MVAKPQQQLTSDGLSLPARLRIRAVPLEHPCSSDVLSFAASQPGDWRSIIGET